MLNLIIAEKEKISWTKLWKEEYLINIFGFHILVSNLTTHLRYNVGAYLVKARLMFKRTWIILDPLTSLKSSFELSKPSWSENKCLK